MIETSLRLEFRILGPLEVRSADGVVDVGAPRQRSLLAFLALNANRVVPRDRIVDALWGERAPQTARNALQVAVHGLRQALGRDRVQTQGAGYMLVLEPDELDFDRFTHLLERAEGEGATAAASTLREALALHRGASLADLPDAPFVGAERERIEELRLVALERRIAADVELGRHAELVPELEALADEHPYRERVRTQLMLALYRSGRQADALEAYRQARAALVDALGVEPSRELQELHAAILRQDEALDPLVRRDTSPATTLPVAPKPLVGRQLELASVTALLRTPGVRLVTLTGPGGTGKTRLALEAGRHLLGDLPGAVHFVDLAPIRDSSLVGPTVARELGVRDAEEERLVERIGAAVGDREILLVLDNLEHVLEAASLIAELLARVPALQVLATSREPLRIGAEHEYRVPPLGLPPRSGSVPIEVAGKAESVELFVARARAARPDFELTNENVASIVDICHDLDGLPLALELAAARMKLLSPAALRDRLDRRLDVLGDGRRDLPDRQRTLRATIDWSYGLLDAPEQELLARLSVFVGGWTLEAAEDVCGADLSSLGSLVEKSLVRSLPDAAGEPRFSMLETVREYALERLLESKDAKLTRTRHAEHFAAVAERLEPELHTARALDEAEREHDNVRAALDYALANGQAALALRLCALARLWYVRGYVNEGRAWIERSLSLEGGTPARLTKVLYWSATLRWTGGDHELAIEHAHESLRLAQAVGDELAQFYGLTALGLAHLGAGDLLTSRRFQAESLALARELGRERNIALSLSNIADIEAGLGNHEQAELLAHESLEISRRVGDVEVMGVALLILAASALERGRAEDAVPMIVESIRCFRSVDFKDFLASSLVALARAEAPGNPTRAARVLGASRTIRAPLGPSQFPWEPDWYDTTLERVRAAVGSERADEALSQGASAAEETIDEELARLA